MITHSLSNAHQCPPMHIRYARASEYPNAHQLMRRLQKITCTPRNRASSPVLLMTISSEAHAATIPRSSSRALLCLSSTGPCYRAMLHGHVLGPCYRAMSQGHVTGPCYRAMLQGHVTGPCYRAMLCLSRTRWNSGMRLVLFHGSPNGTTEAVQAKL